MPGKSRRQNRLLQWNRLQRGWSRAELAIQVNRSIENERDSAEGAEKRRQVPKLIDEETVKSWETRHGTHMDYAKHLCNIFDKPADQLGLLTDEELALRPAAPRQPAISLTSGMVEDRNSRRSTWEVTSMTSGEPTSTWAPAMRAAGVPVDPVQEEILVGIGRQGARSSRTDPQAVASYAAIVAHHRSLYWSTSPRTLLDAASAHLALGAAILKNDPDENPPLASAVAECALLVARLAFFDLDGLDSIVSDAFEAAETCVARAQDHSLAMAIAAHHAFVPGFDRSLSGARPFLVAAERHWRLSEQNYLARSWLHCVSAEIHARSGAMKESRYHLWRAEEYLSKSDGTCPLWMDFFDRARFAGFAGNTALLAGRHADAATWLQQALENLGATSRKQRSVLLLDLAAAHAAEEPERALGFAVDACDQLETDYYQEAVNRIRNVRAAMSGSRSAARLTERAHRWLTPGPTAGA